MGALYQLYDKALSNGPKLRILGYEKTAGERDEGLAHFKVPTVRAYLEDHLVRFQPNRRENPMHKLDLATMQLDELWLIHEELTKILTDKIVAQKRELEERLAKLNPGEIVRAPGNADPSSMADRVPRHYSKVLPKYRNPLAPLETWSGRGKRPRWLVAALETGYELDEFKI